MLHPSWVRLELKGCSEGTFSMETLRARQRGLCMALDGVPSLERREENG